MGSAWRLRTGTNKNSGKKLASRLWRQRTPSGGLALDMIGMNDVLPLQRGTPPQRIIVDFTDLVGHLAGGGAVSGIPRVVFEFTNAAIALKSERGFDLVIGYFDPDQRKYFQINLPDDDCSGDRLRDRLCGSPVFRRGYPRPINLSRLRSKYAQRPAKRYLHLAQAKCRLAGRRLSHRIFRGRDREADVDELRFRPGDLVLMFGSGWIAMPFIDHIEPLQKAGIIKSFVLVYDLIPLMNFKNDDTAPAAIFEPWLERVGRMGCSFLAASEATKSDLQTYFAKKQIDVPPVSVTPLPHEFPVRPEAATLAEIRSIFALDYALFVGPVSGRKNAKRLLEAWAKVLARAGPEKTPILVISSGRGAEAIFETHIRPIESHVRLLNRPADHELSQLYRHAAFTVFPSLYEGWGLPVGESLWCGTPCITSNCASMPEVGGPLCDYVDPSSVDSIAEAIERLACDRQYRDRRAAEIRASTLRTWRDFADTLLTSVCPPRAGADQVLAAAPHRRSGRIGH
jgi:glycosyltransferase involved in cell wall biosynthesis